MNPVDRLFPTTVIGSLPRPEWVREIVLDRKHKRISEEKAARLLDPAIASALALQERAGLEEIADGEWRRESYVKVFADRVHGFKPDLIRINELLAYPAAVAPIEYHRPLVLDEAVFSRPLTQRQLKITLPSPYIIGRRMWSPEHSIGAYPTAEQLMHDCVPILRSEIKELIRSGVDTIQLDEPWLSALVDPTFRQRENIKNVQYEINLCLDLINQVVDGFDVTNIGMHLCHAHFNYTHGTEGPYDIIMTALAQLNVGILSMEYATPVAGGIQSLAYFPSGPRLGLGCVDHCDRTIETPEVIAGRVEAAMQYIDKSRIILHPDCGFSPSVQNPVDLDTAYLKLKSMCEAAEILRSRHS